MISLSFSFNKIITILFNFINQCLLSNWPQISLFMIDFLASSLILSKRRNRTPRQFRNSLLRKRRTQLYHLLCDSITLLTTAQGTF